MFPHAAFRELRVRGAGSRDVAAPRVTRYPRWGLGRTGPRADDRSQRFASADGKGTNAEALALKGPDGRPVNNPARQVWITETALSTALNTSYMAEQVSLFGIAVGAAFLLVGAVLATLALAGLRLPQASFALTRRRPASDPSPAA